MLEMARRELERMRESADAWADLRYTRATDAEGDDYDGNAARRATVLWALQYDLRPDDLPLVRWLAEQEAECRGEAPFQGLTEEIELAGFLLATFRRVEDVWLQGRIKLANFDTSCGYDLEHLFAAGVPETIAFVRDSEHADRDATLELLLDDDRPWVSGQRLAEWFRDGQERFPADPAAEDPMTWIQRAQLIGDSRTAREWLDRWAADRPRDAHTLSQLQYYLADLGALAEAAAAQREAVAWAEDPWDAASAWRTLAALERRAGHHRAAWAALIECRQAFDDVPDWRETGLARAYVEELFLLAGSAEADSAREVFTEADRQARDIPRLPPVVFQAAVSAADRLGLAGPSEYYRRLGP
ncbi:hypothetical protein [Paractinoplanes maris]|uniref:hypothetical protein n=1 Tax=Paractinoplanes maris TaxID=1734446 RepID=UPI0020217FEA|nr:hypothetical protein [Actinoplanes maris]